MINKTKKNKKIAAFRFAREPTMLGGTKDVRPFILFYFIFEKKDGSPK